MRILAALLLLMFPFVAATYSAVHFDARGAADGVLWCIGLLAVFATILFGCAVVEGRLTDG